MEYNVGTFVTTNKGDHIFASKIIQPPLQIKLIGNVPKLTN